VNYCKKHNQKYGTPFCPICVGERMLHHKNSDGKDNTREAIEKTIEEMKNDTVKK